MTPLTILQDVHMMLQNIAQQISEAVCPKKIETLTKEQQDLEDYLQLPRLN